MKLGRMSTIAAACVMAVGTLIGVVGAGTASASGDSPLCTAEANGSQYSVCAYGDGSNPVEMNLPLSTTTNWIYPNVSGTHTPIKQVGTDLCMQLDHNAGNVVIEATCNGASYQDWKNQYVSGTRSTMFFSEWNINTSPLCLSYDIDGGNILAADPCTFDTTDAWYQQFYS
jgi:hypothetical protein